MGYDSPEELIESVTDIERQLYVDPHRRAELFELMQKNRGVVKNFEVEFYRKDGGTRWGLLHARSIFDEKGEILIIEGILQDITEPERTRTFDMLFNHPGP